MLIGGAQFWTTCPGLTSIPKAIVRDYLDVAAKLSCNTYANDLLLRHQTAKRSRGARDQSDEEALRRSIFRPPLWARGPLGEQADRFHQKDETLVSLRHGLRDTGG